jgi:ParB-like chromosome segregation protein Spo0J
MTDQVRMACEREVRTVTMTNILPMRTLSAGIHNSAKYKCIQASIKELGLIEPLVVFPQPGQSGIFMLLDGHMRHLIMKELGQTAAKCLISIDDEAFTYNHKINRLSAVQEHFMIRRAIKNGVSEARIARCLDLDVSTIRHKRDLLEGICEEAVLLLKDRSATSQAFRELRKVKPMRQIEIAELMCAASNFSVGYVKCLAAATPIDQTVEGNRPRELQNLSPEDAARMEQEMVTLSRDFRLIEESHGKNTLNLVIVTGYLRRLSENSRVVRYLAQTYPEILSEFQKLVEARNLHDALPS